MSNLGTILYNLNRKKIEAAYNDYVNKVDGAEKELFNLIIQFAKKKITASIFDVQDSSSTVDDYAQEVAITVWNKLDTLKGGTESFHPWLYRICHTKGIDAFNDITKEKSKHVPLLLETEDGDLEDNPALYNWDERPQYVRKLPDFIQGKDLLICEYIRADYNYAKIGKLLGLTEASVESRVRRMRNKIEEMKNAKG